MNKDSDRISEKSRISGTILKNNDRPSRKTRNRDTINKDNTCISEKTRISGTILKDSDRHSKKTRNRDIINKDSARISEKTRISGTINKIMPDRSEQTIACCCARGNLLALAGLFLFPCLYTKGFPLKKAFCRQTFKYPTLQ